VNISELFIRRPVATSLLMLAIAVFGIVAYQALPVSDLPNVDYPTISVSAGLSGASPETMAASVATPLEKQFSTIAGIDQMTSTSSLGSTSITLQFSLDRPLDGAALDVQACISRTSRSMPAGMLSPPSFRKVDPGAQPIFMLILTSDALPLYQLNEYADTMMGQRISMVDGVAQVTIQGAGNRAVRIQVDPTALTSKGIGMDELANAVRSWNVNMATGELYGPSRTYTIQASGQLLTAEEYRHMIVAYRNARPVRLEEVANVIESLENTRTGAWYYTKNANSRSIMLQVMKQPGTNTIKVVDSIRELLPAFTAALPPSVHVDILFDRSQTIRESFRDIQFTMLLTLGLVIMVIFLFLRNVSATLIPSLALPFSVVGTFAVMYLLGFSLNNLSMMALILCVGFVVDDAIVMLENIVRHMEHGESAMAASLAGSREIGFTIVSMTLSLAAVFIPVLFMGGIVGRLFKEFAITIATAILISGVVSVTLTPMLCSRFLRPPKESKHGRLYKFTESIFDGMLSVYSKTLRWSLQYRWVTMGVSLAVIAATVLLFIKIPKGFIPSEDTDSLSVSFEGVQGASPDDMFRYARALSAIALSDPNVVRLNSSAGGQGGSGNSGRMTLRLKSRKERELSSDQLIAVLRPKFAAVPGVRVFIQNPPPIRIGGMMTRTLYQYTLQGPNIDELYRSAQALEKALLELPSLLDVNSDLLLQKPMVNVDFDRDKAAALQVTANQIETALSASFSSGFVTNIFTPTNTYQVILEVKPEYQYSAAALSQLYVRSGTGRLVPLDTVAKAYETVGAQQINHLGQLPAVTVSFNTAPGVALGDAMAQIRDVSERVLPDTISTSYQGTAQAFQTSFENLYALLFIALLVVYIVLGILYESYIHPITIFSGLPSAGFGALLTLYLFKVELNLYSFVGLIMLIGIVKKNAIMQIDFALTAEREEGKSPMEAIFQGCVIRFRPIMMTTMAALLGAVPIAIGYGAGGESRQPLGLVVVGGLLTSQLVTLYLTPVYYTYLAPLQNWSRDRKTRKAKLIPVTATD
jgi:HAE1 family hydrophobic/amphiphilic exporter-1